MIFMVGNGTEIFQNDYVLEEDIIKAADSNIPLDQLDNHTVLITGATGLIGSQLVKLLLYCNEHKKMNIRILAPVRDVQKAGRVLGDLVRSSQIEIFQHNILSEFNIAEPVDYIIHGASMTSSKAFVEYPVETIKTAVIGSMNLLELAKLKMVKGFVYLSSLEIYGVPGHEKTEINETDYGYIDPMNVRSSYSESKRMVECMCVSYGSEYGIPVKIARLSQTFGAGVEYNDSRVFAQFARCVIERKNIVLHTKGDTIRNYCYTRDAIRALIYILVRGKAGEAYNVANESTTISIRDMAQLLINQYPDCGIELMYEIDEEQKHGYNPTVKIKLDTNKLQALGWKAEVTLSEMFDRMIQSMRINHDK